MAIAERDLRKSPRARIKLGLAKPRLSPPVPARSDLPAFRDVAKGMGIELMPWQETAARYLTALAPDGKLLYSEVAVVVARQQGKTTLAKPLIIRALKAGKRVMHIAQTRELPRLMFGTIADALSNEPDLFPKRRGRTIWPRYGSGQEEITLQNGGTYRIAAANRGGARGYANDLVIIDELLEMDSFEIVSAAEPTLTMSSDPQMVYLSNAGTDSSVVLNAVRARAGEDPALAYLEWSASPEREPDDRDGWAEANPALGHSPSVLKTLESAYRRHKLAGTMSIFETEHLCRWVVTMQPKIVDQSKWQAGHGKLPNPVRPFMAISMDSSGTRASSAIAWALQGEKVGLKIVSETSGAPIDSDTVGKALKEYALRSGVRETGFDPWTDADLARHIRGARIVNGREFVNACEKFVRLVESGYIVWDEADEISDDLLWAARKPHDQGTWVAVKAKEDRPITAVLAAIRAVWLASGPRPEVPRVL